MQTKTSTRLSTASSPSSNNKTFSSASPLLSATLKRKTMSVTQTYYLAHKARAKLSSEAARADHNLRLLVGHANLLDSLMLELADAEREQESWFNQSVRGASPKQEERHVQWADSVIEEPEQDWQAEDAESDDSESDSDSEFDNEEEEDVEMAGAISLRRVPSNRVPSVKREAEFFEHEDIYEDDEEDYAQLSLARTPSHPHSPPELDHDDESSEDESMPPSPPSTVLPSFPQGKGKESDAFYEEELYLPARNPARLVSAISVY